MSFADAAGLRGDALRPRLDDRRHARRHARVSREAQARVHGTVGRPTAMRIALVVSALPRVRHRAASRPARARRCARPAWRTPTSRRSRCRAPSSSRRRRSASPRPARWSRGGLPGLPDSRRDAALRLHRAGGVARHHARGAGDRRAVAFGVLTTNTAEEALARAGDGAGEQGPRGRARRAGDGAAVRAPRRADGATARP